VRDIRIILPDIRSAHNVGSIFRTADCFGASHIYFCGYTPYPRTENDTRLPHESEKITKQISKTALGAESTISFSRHQDIHELIKELKEDGYAVASIEQAKDSVKLSDYKPAKKIAIILGNEVNGLDEKIIRNTDITLEIPLLGNKESLNVSSTCAIVLYILRYSCYD
jgi:tRNA G18 (ribose-2'-O)-methylase SpoU